ncbi:hypothetical protein RSOLAG22IIIB_04122 [Rhizoctonia solani]|uniref:Uncharacterized protein n=1 Tax=Rhizoctonia solani TaxID=456999 RepID=A0A0K6FUH4_9AGAM|nr:hypothetical protein RSOLAG22IIIB_04122 [Rhizoctonia solani]
MTTPSESLPPPPIYKRGPNINDHPKLAEKRYNQWRRFSRDPYRLPEDIKPPTSTTQQEPGEKLDWTDNIEPKTAEVCRRLKFPGPLANPALPQFYDLAWTATFATLILNEKYTEPMDAASYFTDHSPDTRTPNTGTTPIHNNTTSFWVLPTIAIAYGVQFLIEIVLAYFARRATLKAKDNDKEKGTKDKVEDKDGDENEVEAETEAKTETRTGVLTQSLSYSALDHRSRDQVV